MNLYEHSLQKELYKWHKEMKKPPSFINGLTKSVQIKMQALVPEKIQNTITLSITKMTETIMFGSSLLTATVCREPLSLAESDFLVEKAFKTYKNTAVMQGIGFGAGGIMLGLADFPALLTIKIKFLFDCAKLYGYDVNDKNERLYMLYVFQLAFSSDEHRLSVYNILMNWNRNLVNANDIDWEKFQLEYRDYIDLAKMLQLLPVVGAVAGGIANHSLLEKLKTTAMNCYRSRYLDKRDGLNTEC